MAYFLVRRLSQPFMCCLFFFAMFYASASHAQFTVITGSYSEVSAAKVRLNDPAFKSLGAFLLHSKSQQFSARVAVGCFPSPELARQAVYDVRGAGAKGVWILDVGGLCSAKATQALRPATAYGQHRNIAKRHFSHKQIAFIKIPPEFAPVNSMHHAIAEAAPPKNKDIVLAASAIQPTRLAFESPPSPPAQPKEIVAAKDGFKPTDWHNKKIAEVAFTSGLNPAIFKKAQSPCYRIIRIPVNSLVGIKPPDGIENYEAVQSDGSTCYTAYIYFAETGEK